MESNKLFICAAIAAVTLALPGMLGFLTMNEAQALSVGASASLDASVEADTGELPEVTLPEADLPSAEVTTPPVSIGSGSVRLG
jgi:hypothetical protein